MPSLTLEEELKLEKLTRQKAEKLLKDANKELRVLRKRALEAAERDKILQEAIDGDDTAVAQVVIDLKENNRRLQERVARLVKQLGAPRTIQKYKPGDTLPAGAEVHGMDDGYVIASIPEEE